MRKTITLLIALAGIARAQTANSNSLEGLPQYGVILSGSPENPIIENHSGKVVIGYEMKFADANGRGPGLNQLVAENSLQPAGIPDGGSVYASGAMPLNPPVPMPTPARARAPGAIVKATLTSVIFADGHFVGVDEHGTFELFGQKIKTFTEVGILAKNQAWDQVEALAQLPMRPSNDGGDSLLYFGRRSNAIALVQERKFKGDAAASKLAEIYSSLPILWKQP